MGRHFWGAVLIVAGTLLFLQALNVLTVGMTFWSVVLLIVGLNLVLRGVFPGPFSLRSGPSWFTTSLGLWIGGIGLFNVLHANNLTDLDGRTLFQAGWPILLVGLGLSLLRGGSFSSHRLSVKHGTSGGGTTKDRGWSKRSKGSKGLKGSKGSTVSKESEGTKPGRAHSPGRHLNLRDHMGLIGDIHYGRNPWELHGHLSVRRLIGDIRIDLTSAEISDGRHDITVVASIGEIVIIVPRDCSALVEASALIGDVRVFGDERDGIGNHLARESRPPDAASLLHIRTRLRIGTITIRRPPGNGGDQSGVDRGSDRGGDRGGDRGSDRSGGNVGAKPDDDEATKLAMSSDVNQGDENEARRGSGSSDERDGNHGSDQRDEHGDREEPQS